MHVIPEIKRLEKKWPENLVVIGVHSAKFSSEKRSENIKEAIIRHDLQHAVINDKDFQIWNMFGVQAWPTLALIDPEGRYRGAKSGENVFDVFDNAITTLVKEYGGKGKLNKKPIRLVLEKEHRPKSLLSYPTKLAADPKTRRLFFSDTNHHRIVVASVDGAVQEVIGNGAVGFKDGDFTTARFFRPQGVAFDAARNALYVADTENHAIRKIDLSSKRVTTLAGTGEPASMMIEGGPGTKTSLRSPWDVLVRDESLYIAMAGSHQIWRLDLKTDQIEVWAGTGRENILDGSRLEANFAQPSGLSTDGKWLFVADSEVSGIRRISLTGLGPVETLIGEGLFEFGDTDGSYPAARLQHPLGVDYHDDKVWVADTYNHKIKVVDPAKKSVVTVLGSGKRGIADGPASVSSFNEPNGLRWIGAKLYIADTNNHLLRIYDPATKLVSTLRLSAVEKLKPQSTAGAIKTSRLP